MGGGKERGLGEAVLAKFFPEGGGLLGNRKKREAGREREKRKGGRAVLRV